MPPESFPRQPGHTCTHPDCCPVEAAKAEAPVGEPPETLADRPEPHEDGRWGSFKRYALWFLAFFGIYASSSVCPFCGNPGCPVGVGGAALVGGVLACLWRYGKMILTRLRELVALLRRSHQA